MHNIQVGARPGHCHEGWPNDANDDGPQFADDDHDAAYCIVRSVVRIQAPLGSNFTQWPATFAVDADGSAATAL